jgi:hypothetical protein
MDFDPDAYLSSAKQPAGAGGFDPDAYLANNKAAAPNAAPPKAAAPSAGAGMDWYSAVRKAPGAIWQAFGDLMKAEALPALNAASLIPGKIGERAQATARDWQRDVPQATQFVGGVIGGAPLAMGAAALTEPLMVASPLLAPLVTTGTGAALGAATSRPGERGTGALFGAAGAAIPSALQAAKYGIGRVFAPGIKNATDANAVRAAQNAEFIVPPSEITGSPQFAREVAGSFGPFAKKVPEKNIETFGRQVFDTLGLRGETQVNARNVNRAIQKISGDFLSRIGNTKLTIDPNVASAIDSAITQNKPMLAELVANPQSKGVAAAIHRAQEGQAISGQDYYKVSQWLRNKAATTSDGATRDALENLEKAWQTSAQGDTARVSRALRVYRTRMTQALDLQKMMTDPGVAAGTKPVDPAKLYTTMARGKPSVLAGASSYGLAPLSQSAAVTQAFGTGTKVPGWAERAASMEGIAAMGNGEVRLPYTGKLSLPQQALFGTAGLLSHSVLNQLATPEGQQMLISGYRLTPEDIKFLATLGALGATSASAISTKPSSQ